MHDCDDCEQALAEMLCMGFEVRLYVSERGTVAVAKDPDRVPSELYSVGSGINTDVGPVIATLLERCRHVQP